MKTTIVTGLLGSGKTTFIKHSIRSAQERTVVLVNDFGAAGVDGEIFSAAGIESVELPSGCICCTLKVDLVTTIRRIVQEFSPEHLVIEPSGIASPVGVLEALESCGITSYSVIGVVDVTEFAELYRAGIYGNFFHEQIEMSDVVLVNKMDLVEEGKMAEAEELIVAINPRAILFRTEDAFPHHPLPAGERKAATGGTVQRLSFGSSSHIHFETLSFTLNAGMPLAGFSKLFQDVVAGRFGSVARAKALLHTDKGPYRFDGVYGKIDRVPFEKDIEEGRLVVIGEKLDRQAMEQAVFS